MQLTLLTKEETCLQFIPGGGAKPYSAMYQFWTYSLLKPPPQVHSLSFQADQLKSVHWAQEAEALLEADEVAGGFVALDVEDGAATTELALALLEGTMAADEEDLLAAADEEVTADCFATDEITEETAVVLAAAALLVVEVGVAQPHPKPNRQNVRLSSDFSASTVTGAAEVSPARPR